MAKIFYICSIHMRTLSLIRKNRIKCYLTEMCFEHITYDFPDVEKPWRYLKSAVCFLWEDTQICPSVQNTLLNIINVHRYPEAQNNALKPLLLNHGSCNMVCLIGLQQESHFRLPDSKEHLPIASNYCSMIRIFTDSAWTMDIQVIVYCCHSDNTWCP